MLDENSGTNGALKVGISVDVSVRTRCTWQEYAKSSVTILNMIDNAKRSLHNIMRAPVVR
eukprot:SAG31_NODE_101_length_25195_cov_67.436758_6_plen_60_part_00